MSQPSVSSLTHHYTREWFNYIDAPLKELVKTAFSLYDFWQTQQQQGLSNQIKDFSFVSFPMAIAYEGFLKQYLKDLQLIDLELYQSRRFRIGRALNPDIRPQHQDEKWLFDNLAQECSQPIAREIWNTWLDCRNRVFHYFPANYQPLTLGKAGENIQRMAEMMEQAVSCQSPERLKLIPNDQIKSSTI